MDFKELRLRKDLSQRELAEIVGCHLQQVSNWERGAAPLPEKHVKQFCKVVGANPKEVCVALVDRYADRLRKKSKIQF